MTHDHDPDFTNPKLNGAQAMTATRRADTISERDYGRTITGTDALTGDTFAGTLQTGHYNPTDDYVCIHINRYPQLLRRDDLVEVAGAVVAPEVQVVGNILRKDLA